MAAFDPFLYVAFGAGFAAGRLLPWRTPWIGRATMADVGILLVLLGASLSEDAGTTLLREIPLSIGFALLILILTVAVVWLLSRPASAPGGASRGALRFAPLSAALAGAVAMGYVVGRFIALPTGVGLTVALYALLALVAFDIELTREGLGRVWVPISASVIGALLAAPIFALATATSLRVDLATSLGFGWYSLAGPLIATHVGPTVGLLAFLTNFLRENFTMLSAPSVGPRVRAEGLTAMGGATAMDTTLYFVVRYGDARAGSLALSSGFILTIAASLLLPAVLALPLP